MWEKTTVDDFRRKLEQACEWLDIARGRARDYVCLIEEFERGEHGPKQLLAYREAYDIVELFQLWETEIDHFPGLKTKLKQACRKGPAMTDDEKTSNSGNQPRNDTFVYLMAGRFRSAGIPVGSVDGISAGAAEARSAEDFSIRWDRLDINVECKRPNSANGFKRLAKSAQKQINKRQRRGIIAMDCSRLARPAGTVLEAESPREAYEMLDQGLENVGVWSLPNPMPSKVLGVILFARVPAMTAMRILDANEQAVRRSECITAMLVVGNRYSSDQTVLRDIAQRLRVERRAAPSQMGWHGGSGRKVTGQ